MSSNRISCTFLFQVNGLGYIDPGNISDDIEAGSKFDLPLWLCEALCQKSNPFVTVHYPKQYKAGFREILDADSTVVDLNKNGPYFHHFGRRLTTFKTPESLSLAKVLLSAFNHRIIKIMKLSSNCLIGPQNEKVKTFDVLEQNLFMLGQAAVMGFLKWSRGRERILETSKTIEYYRKRKLID